MQKQLIALTLILASVTPVWARKKAKKARKSSTASSASATSGNGGRFDASSLMSAAPEVKGDSPSNSNGKKRREFRKNDAAPKGLMNVDTKEILATLRGINLLLSKKPSESDRVKLLLNRAMASYSLARRRLIESKSLKVDATGKKLLSIAQKDAATVAAMPNMPKSILAKSNYITGLAMVYLDDVKGARERFIKAIEMDPNSENTGWMAIFIAEDLFDNEQFREAIYYYQKYMRVFDAREQELSKYKLAWCYINLQQNDRAKRYFIDLIKGNSTSGFGKDSVKDLAFLVAVGGNEDEILRTADSVFRDKTDQEKIDFLSAVSANLEAQGNIRLFARLLDRLLRIEKDPTKKLGYLIAAVRTSRREFASVVHYNAVLRVRDFLEKEGIYPGKKAFEDQRSPLDLEAQNVLKSYVETFAGRTKTPENLSRVQIGQNLKNLFAFYHKYFNASKTYPAVVKLWLDVCIELGDWPCVDSVADIILNNDKLADLQPKAAFEQLAALDRLKSTQRADQPESDRDKKLLKKLEEFVATQESNPRWMEMATRLGDLYLTRKDFDKALPLYDRLFEKDPSADSHYRLQFARFQAGKYEELVQDGRRPKGKVDPRYIDLKREAALKLASKSRDKDDIETYTVHIREFLASNPAPDKAMAARKDYYNFLLSKERVSDLTGELLQLPAAMRMSNDFKDVVEATWVRNMRMARFKDAIALVTSTDRKVKVPSVNRSRRFLAQLCLGQTPPQADFRDLAPENRQYIGGVLALTKPRLAVRYFNDRKDHLVRADERPLAALALRIDSGDWALRPTERNKKMLGASFDYKEAPKLGELSVEKKIRAIQFPSPKASQKRLAIATEQLIRDTRYIRGRIPKEIAGKPTVVQARAVHAAKELEAKVGEFIKSSPLPPNLQPNQVEEFEKALADAAKEYENQAAEFDKLEQSISATLQKGEAEAAAKQLYQPDMSQWPYPDFLKSDQAEGLRVMMDGANYTAALVVLDLFRPEPLKSNDDYYRLRAGILLMSRDADSMRKYVFDELEAANQKGLLDKWREMTSQGKKQDADL